MNKHNLLRCINLDIIENCWKLSISHFGGDFSGLLAITEELRESLNNCFVGSDINLGHLREWDIRVDITNVDVLQQEGRFSTSKSQPVQVQ